MGHYKTILGQDGHRRNLSERQKSLRASNLELVWMIWW